MSILKTIQETFFSPKITILLIVIGGFLVKNNSFASDSTSTMLDEVTIEKEKHNEQNYSFDTKIEIDTLLKESLQHSTLSEYIKGASPIFLRESGSGMTSTISMRGTQASHTNVYWNGFSINSQTMGQVDFNLIPIFFIELRENIFINIYCFADKFFRNIKIFRKLPNLNNTPAERIYEFILRHKPPDCPFIRSVLLLFSHIKRRIYIIELVISFWLFSDISHTIRTSCRNSNKIITIIVTMVVIIFFI